MPAAQDELKDQENPFQPAQLEDKSKRDQGGDVPQAGHLVDEGQDRKLTHPTVDLTNPTSGSQYALNSDLPVDYEVTGAPDVAVMELRLRSATGKVVFSRSVTLKLDANGRINGTQSILPLQEGVAAGKYKLDAWVTQTLGGSSPIKSVDVEFIDESKKTKSNAGPVSATENDGGDDAVA
jgi:hypothetical protein